MAHPKKKLYQAGSPGQRREQSRVTLNSIKKQIAASERKTETRKQFRDQGLLG